jgi:hypothetical protein
MANEKRLIDANALEELGELPYVYDPVADGEPWYRAEDVGACIEREPTAPFDSEKEYIALHNKYDALLADYRAMETEFVRMRAQLDIVELIFGGGRWR